MQKSQKQHKRLLFVQLFRIQFPHHVVVVDYLSNRRQTSAQPNHGHVHAHSHECLVPMDDLQNTAHARLPDLARQVSDDMHSLFGDVLRVALVVCGHEFRDTNQRAHQQDRARLFRMCARHHTDHVLDRTHNRLAEDQRVAQE